MHRYTPHPCSCLAALFSLFLTLSLPNFALADSFDVMGFKTGMSIDEFEQHAQKLADGQVDVNEVGIRSPLDGTIVEGTVYIAGYKFKTGDTQIEATPTSEPMKPVIYKLTRGVNYNHCGQHISKVRRCQDLGPEYPVFEESLISKYGEPVWQRSKRISRRIGATKEVQLMFTDGDITASCREIVLPKGQSYNVFQLGVPSNYHSSADVKRAFDSCPVFLHVRLEYLERVDQPTLNASFTMRDVGLEAEYETTYTPYWTKWMEDNFVRPKNDDRPEL